MRPDQLKAGCDTLQVSQQRDLLEKSGLRREALGQAGAHRLLGSRGDETPILDQARLQAARLRRQILVPRCQRGQRRVHLSAPHPLELQRLAGESERLAVELTAQEAAELRQLSHRRAEEVGPLLLLLQVDVGAREIVLLGGARVHRHQELAHRALLLPVSLRKLHDGQQCASQLSQAVVAQRVVHLEVVRRRALLLPRAVLEAAHLAVPLRRSVPAQPALELAQLGVDRCEIEQVTIRCRLTAVGRPRAVARNGVGDRSDGIEMVATHPHLLSEPFRLLSEALYRWQGLLHLVHVHLRQNIQKVPTRLRVPRALIRLDQWGQRGRSLRKLAEHDQHPRQRNVQAVRRLLGMRSNVGSGGSGEDAPDGQILVQRGAASRASNGALSIRQEHVDAHLDAYPQLLVVLAVLRLEHFVEQCTERHVLEEGLGAGMVAHCARRWAFELEQESRRARFKGSHVLVM